jgi:zinc protease
MRQCIVACIILLLCGSGFIWSSEMVTKRLDNGLTVVIINDPSASLVSVRTFVRAGSIDEAPHLGSGLSHYLEHIVAGGSTEIRPESEYKRVIA